MTTTTLLLFFVKWNVVGVPCIQCVNNCKESPCIEWCTRYYSICICAEKRKKELLSWRWEMAFFVMSCMSIEFFLFFIFYLFFFFQFPNIYSNTLVHSSPPPSSLLYGKMGSITLFFFQMGILDMIQHFMHEILVGSSQYFTSYYNESRHLCESNWKYNNNI